MMATLTWEEYLGWELSFIRTFSLRFGLVDPPDVEEKEDGQGPGPQEPDEDAAYQRIQDFAADWATREADEARQ